MSESGEIERLLCEIDRRLPEESRKTMRSILRGFIGSRLYVTRRDLIGTEERLYRIAVAGAMLRAGMPQTECINGLMTRFNIGTTSARVAIIKARAERTTTRLERRSVQMDGRASPLA